MAMNNLGMNLEGWQFVVSLVTMLGSGIAVFIATRIGIAESREQMKYLQKQLDEMKKDIDKIENHLYK